MPSAPRQWQRIQEVERASVVVWYLLIGAGLIAGTAFAMRHEFSQAPPGFLGLAGALLGSDRAIAAAGGVELEATLSCKRRESETYADNDRKQQVRTVDNPVWS